MKENISQRQPLVSIVVITYNSSSTIQETLESIKLQTYNNIELIVSDDHSSDKTLEIVQLWLDKNKSHFTQIKIVTSENNTGISSNLNRGCSLSSGLWIKLLAGDDVLFSNAIELYMDYVKDHPFLDLIVAKVKGIGNNEAMKKHLVFNSDNYFLRLNDKEKKILLCIYNFIPAASTFFSKKLYVLMGGFDESISLVDDWPFYLKVIHNGYRMGYMQEYTTGYRFSSTSISQPQNTHSRRYLEDCQLSLNVANNYMRTHGLFAKIYVRLKEKKNKYNKACQIFCSIIEIMNPFYWYIRYINYKVR